MTERTRRVESAEFLKEIVPLVQECVSVDKDDCSLVPLLELPYFIWSIHKGLLVDGVFVEIGVRRAGTTKIICSLLKKSGRKIYCIDPETHPGYHRSRRWAREAGIGFEFISEMSQGCGDRVKEPIAWVFVDGCHCFECVRDDFDVWVPKLASGGILVLHDTSAVSAYAKRTPCLRSSGLPKYQCSLSGAKESREMCNLRTLAIFEIGPLPGIRIYEKR